MIVDAVRLKRALRACTAIATSDAAESKTNAPMLLGVCQLTTDAKARTVALVVADGHRALRVTLPTRPDDYVAPDGTRRVLVSLNAIDEIDRATGGLARADVTGGHGEIAIDSKGGARVTFLHGGTYGIDLPPFDMTTHPFPHARLELLFAQLAKKPPQKSLAYVEWEFNPVYLHEFSTLLARFNGEGVKRAWFHWPLEVGDPVGFHAHGSEWALDYLLMPCVREP